VSAISRHDARVRVSAKADYGLRAAIELAGRDRLVRAQDVAEAQSIPLKFLETILQQLRQARLVESARGPHGGHRLARPPEEIRLADVIRALDGPLAGVNGAPPEELPEGPMRDVWIAVRVSLRRVLEQVTLADVAGGELPRDVVALLEEPDAWVRR
jgi:Rrf2 family protein